MAEEHKTDQEKINKVGELIREVEIAMFTTIADDGTVRSRPMRYRQSEGGFDGKLYFFTKQDSGKVEQVEHTQQVNVAFSNPKSQDYVSIAGVAHISHDRAKMTELWNPLFKAWFPDGLEDPQLALLVVTVEGAEYWDSPTSPVAHLFGFVKSRVTGAAPKVGDNEKVAIDGRPATE